jgi:hypothetical protein
MTKPANKSLYDLEEQRIIRAVVADIDRGGRICQAIIRAIRRQSERIDLKTGVIR